MRIYGEFVRDEAGAVTIDWVALTAGILLLGIMVVYAIFNGGVAGIVTSINATLTDVAAGADTGAIPSLGGVELAGDPMLLPDGSFLPVGTKLEVESFDGKLIGAPPGTTANAISFYDSSGTFISSTMLVGDQFAVLNGATVSSATAFTLSDANGGGTVLLSDFIETRTSIID